MSGEFKPCPFCGGVPGIGKHEPKEYIPPHIRNMDAVEILPCCTMVRCYRYNSLAEAIAAWNKRPSPWISVEEELPKTGSRVIVMFKNRLGNKRTSLAEYVAKRTILHEDFISEEWEDFHDYDEVNDIYYAPEGWYEYNFEAETSMYMSMEITHWMPIPELTGEKI